MTFPDKKIIYFILFLLGLAVLIILAVCSYPEWKTAQQAQIAAFLDEAALKNHNMEEGFLLAKKTGEMLPIEADGPGDHSPESETACASLRRAILLAKDYLSNREADYVPKGFRLGEIKERSGVLDEEGNARLLLCLYYEDAHYRTEANGEEDPSSGEQNMQELTVVAYVLHDGIIYITTEKEAVTIKKLIT